MYINKTTCSKWLHKHCTIMVTYINIHARSLCYGGNENAFLFWGDAFSLSNCNFWKFTTRGNLALGIFIYKYLLNTRIDSSTHLRIHRTHNLIILFQAIRNFHCNMPTRQGNKYRSANMQQNALNVFDRKQAAQKYIFTHINVGGVSDVMCYKYNLTTSMRT